MNPLISPARFKSAIRSGSGSIEFGITQLINGQAYVDVVLVTTLSDTIWDTVCSVVNTTDATPLNIWPGMITAKSTTGFTVQLNGMPDSDNYFLHWTIIPGAAAPVVVATSYLLSGPSSGLTTVSSTPFTVQLSSGQTVPAPVTVTPSDGGGGGTFSPTTVTLTTAAPSATFTYTPASTGAKTISVTNNKGLTDPGNLTYTATPPPFTPASVAGLKVWLKADVLALSDGAAVSSWTDSSGLANHATQGTSGARPIYKTNIVNAKPVVRFDGVDDFLTLGTALSVTADCCVFVVHQTSGDCCLVGSATASTADQMLRVGESGGNILSFFNPTDGSHVSSALSVPRTSWNTAVSRRISGGVQLFESAGYVGGGAATVTMEIKAIGAVPGVSALFTTHDVAEVIIYDNALSGTDFNAVHHYLGTKYGITVALRRADEHADL